MWVGWGRGPRGSPLRSSAHRASRHLGERCTRLGCAARGPSPPDPLPARGTCDSRPPPTGGARPFFCTVENSTPPLGGSGRLPANQPARVADQPTGCTRGATEGDVAPDRPPSSAARTAAAGRREGACGGGGGVDAWVCVPLRRGGGTCSLARRLRPLSARRDRKGGGDGTMDDATPDGRTVLNSMYSTEKGVGALDYRHAPVPRARAAARTNCPNGRRGRQPAAPACARRDGGDSRGGYT